jgi:hypothetical protein
MNEGSPLPEREKTTFEPKAVVANSGKPKKVNTWARQFMGWCMRAPMEAQLAALAAAGVKRIAPTKEDRAEFARIFRERNLWGRKNNTHGYFGVGPNHNGDREIERRSRQVERGLLSPIYRDTRP